MNNNNNTIKSNTASIGNNENNQKSNSINQIYENDIYTDEPFYEKKKQEFSMIDDYLKRKKNVIQKFKENVIEHKEEYIQTLQQILLKYGKSFEQDGNEIDYIDIYKNYIRVMVLLLNADEQIKYLFQNVLESNFQLDSFYAPFSKDIQIDKNTNGQIIFFDIHISNISHQDTRLTSHMIMFGEYMHFVIFKDYFINNHNQKANRINNVQLNINYQNREIIVNIENKIQFNIFELLNYCMKFIISSNSINFLYYDNYKFIFDFLNIPELQTIENLILLIRNLRPINVLNVNLIKKNEQDPDLYRLGTRTIADDITLNSFMIDNIFSLGHFNILFMFVVYNIIKNQNLSKDNFYYLKYNINDVLFDIINKNHEYAFTASSLRKLPELFDKKEIIKIQKLMTKSKLKLNEEQYLYISESNILSNRQKKINQFNELFTYLISIQNTILKQINTENYFLYSIQSPKIINIGRYFNIAQYPIFYHFDIPSNLFINKDKLRNQYQQIFQSFQKPTILYLQKIKLIQYIYFLCKMNDEIQKNKTKDIDIIFEEQKKNILEREEILFLQQFLPQNQRTNDIEQLNSFIDSSILEPIQQLLEKKYEYFDLCLFYYSFFNYMNLYQVSISLHNHISKRIRNLNNKSKIQSIDNIVKYMIIDYMGYLRPQTKEILKKKWIKENENIIYQNMQQLYNYNYGKIKEGKININQQNKNHIQFGNIFQTNINNSTSLNTTQRQSLYTVPNNWKEISQNERNRNLKEEAQSKKNIFERMDKINRSIQQKIQTQKYKYDEMKRIIQRTEQKYKNIEPDLIQIYKTSNINQLQKIYEKTQNQDLKDFLNTKSKLNKLKQQLKNYEQTIKPVLNKTLNDIKKEKIEYDEKLKKIFILHEDISIKKKNQKILKDIYDNFFFTRFITQLPNHVNPLYATTF